MIKTSSAKAKGRNLQKYVRDKILSTFSLLEGDVESRSMGAGGVDILLSPMARSVCPLSIECKATAKTPSRAEMEQAKYNRYEGTIPCVVWKPKGVGEHKSLIMFETDEFLDWLSSIPRTAFSKKTPKETADAFTSFLSNRSNMQGGN